MTDLRVPVRSIGIGLALCLLTVPPLRAENPRISLALEGVTLPEALAALGKASGIPLRMGDGQGAAPDVRFTGVWKDAPFARALREVAGRFNASIERAGAGSYVVIPGMAEPPLPAGRRVGVFNSAGQQLWVSAVNWSNNRVLRFDGQEAGDDDSQLILELGGRSESGDAEAFAGIRNVTALDDLGNRLVAESDEGERNVYCLGLPDEWMGSVRIPSPHPRARKLQWLRGDVYAFQRFDVRRFELPLPEVGQSVTRTVGTVVVHLTRTAPSVAAPGMGQPDLAVMVKSRVTGRGEAPAFSPETADSLAPILLDDAGRLVEPVTLNANSHGDEQGNSLEFECGYPAGPGKPAKMLYYLVNKDQPKKLFSFKLTAIPLPQEKPFRPHKLPPAPAGEEPASQLPSSLHAAGGAQVQFSVEVAGSPRTTGTLQVGISRREGMEWSAIRWLPVELTEDGLAVIHDLRPGQYRFIQRYQPGASWKPPSPGSWSGERFELTAGMGGVHRAPRLSWTPQRKPVPRG